MVNTEKIDSIQKNITGSGLDAMVITNPANIFYLLGFNAFDENERPFLMVINKNGYRLIVPRFYQNRLDGLVPEESIAYVDREKSTSETLAFWIENQKMIGFEREDMSFARYEVLKNLLRGKKLKPVSGLVEELRKIKSSEEISIIKKAATITDNTFAELVKLIKPGITELILKRKVVEIMQDLGAQSSSFDSVIAAGPGGADPHYEGSNRRIKNGEMVVVDIGARYKNYDADLTRMVFLGKATKKYRDLYNIVLETQQKALAECVIGAAPKTIYENCVANFAKYGQDQYFTHGLGHGVGIDIHEAPSLSALGTGTLQNGMVFTVEPGLYHLGWGGIRIEDLCVMRNNKLEILSKAPKDLIEIDC